MVAEARETTTSTSNVARYRRDVPAMAAELCHIKHPATGITGPIELYPHQHDWLTEANRRDEHDNLIYHDVVACWPKGDGKTLVVALLLIHRLLFYPGSTSYILANSERQGAAVLFGEVRSILESSPAIMGGCRDLTFDNTRIHSPSMGTQINVLPCNRRTVQGYRPGPWGVFASDEVHAAQDTMAFDYMAAQCEAINCQVAVSSQAGPPVPENPLWGYNELQERPEILWSYSDQVRAPAPKRQAERDRARLSAIQWAMFWGNAWGSSGAKLLDPDDVDACVRDYTLPTTREELRETIADLRDGARVDAIGGGLDRAMSYMRLSHGDRTIWATVARTAEVPRHYVVVQLDILGEAYTDAQLATMTEQQRSELSKGEVVAAAERARAIGARHHTLEQYQAQDLVGQIQGATLKHMTQPRKVGLYNTLGELVTARQLTIPACRPLLRNELLSITVDTSTSSTPRFEGKPHDDAVDGVLNALDGVLPERGEQVLGTRVAEKASWM